MVYNLHFILPLCIHNGQNFKCHYLDFSRHILWHVHLLEKVRLDISYVDDSSEIWTSRHECNSRKIQVKF